MNMAIILSYRREDSLDVSGRLYDRLVEKFGQPKVFKDVDSIEYGRDFRTEIHNSIGDCSVLLAIIGPKWLKAQDEEGESRLFNEQDYVRIEIETAFSQNLVIIPVLINNAIMPKPEDLPPSLRELSFRHAIQVRPDPDFHPDVNRLIRSLEAELNRGMAAVPRVVGSLMRHNRVWLAVLASMVFVMLFWFFYDNRDLPLDISSETQTRMTSVAPMPTGDLTIYSEGISLRDTWPSNDESVLSDSLAVAGLDKVVSTTIGIFNSSQENVYLSNCQVFLGGIVLVYEDQIADPIAPEVENDIPPLTVVMNAPPRNNYADLREIFEDEDTPDSHLDFSIIENTNPDLVQPRLSNGYMLGLEFLPSVTGEADITVRATDPFDLSSDATMSLTVVEYQGMAVMYSAGGRGSGMMGQQNSMKSRLSSMVVGNDTRINLGNHVFSHSLDRTEVVAGQSSGDMFGSDRNHIVPPGDKQSFLINTRFVTRIRSDYENDLRSDMLVGLEDSQRRLSAEVPQLVEAWYFFFVTMRAVSETGERHNIVADKAFVLHSSPDFGEDDLIELPTGYLALRPQKCLEVPLQTVMNLLMDSTIKTTGETQVFEKAWLCEAIPESLDPKTVSEFCYYSDRGSPFRNKFSESFASGKPWLRSNLLANLQALQQSQAEIWPLVDDQIRMAKSDSLKNRNMKSAYLGTVLGIAD